MINYRKLVKYLPSGIDKLMIMPVILFVIKSCEVPCFFTIHAATLAFNEMCDIAHQWS